MSTKHKIYAYVQSGYSRFGIINSKNLFKIMKQMRPFLTFLLAILAFSAFGQTIDFDKIETPDPNKPFFDEPQDYRTLGIDVGISYLTSDVRAVWGGWGIGVTYEKNMVHQKGGAFDLGIRGRLMYANSRGFDNRATVGVRDNPLPAYKSDSSFFANHFTSQGELAVEGVLTFNQLREKQGIYATLFGGLGIVGYDVRIDQLDANGAKYNYKSLGETPTLAQVKALHDGNFETSRLGGDTLTGVGFMPSIGAEIGFQVSPKFMIVLGHKWLFTGTDLFDGKEYINKVDLGIRKDFHQYTHLSLKWILGANKRRQQDPQPVPPQPTYPNPTYPTPTNPTPTSTEKLPIVRFTSPSAYLETTRERLPIVVKIDHVFDYPSVFLMINGRESRDFAFRNGELTADIQLVEGSNSVTASARNSRGSSSDNVNITLRREGQNPTNPTTPTTPTAVAPRVQITSTGTPTTDNFGGCKTNIEARIENVNSRNEIQMTVNGRAVSNFSFDNNTKILRGPLSLSTGSNQVVIEARNSAGNGNDQRTITCTEKPRQAAPTVQINKPSNGQNFDVNPVDVRATVQNVSNRNQIEVYLNGNRVTDFVYYNYDKSVTARVNANGGENQIRIKATNDGGSSEDVTRFNLTEKPRSNAPTVQILRPSNNARISEATANLEAKVDNVNDKNGIQVIVNGVEDRSFTFDNFIHIVRLRANMRNGQNTITVRAQNETGNAEAGVNVFKRGSIEPPPPPPSKTPPAVAISNPASGSRTVDPSVNLAATASNVVKNQVKVFLNGREVGFTMVGQQIQTVLNLAIGDNSVTVRATNNDGTDEKTTAITRDRVKRTPDGNDRAGDTEVPTNDGGIDKTEQSPTITNFSASQPVIDPFDPKPAVSVVSATVGGVKNAGQIEIYINGAQQTDFTFDAETQQVRLNFQPKSGVSYTFNIVARNSVGRTSKTEVVKF
jgi:Bacterial Ig domain